MFSGLKNPCPSITVNIQHEDAVALQVTRTENGVTLAYLDHKSNIVDADHISLNDEPDLARVVNITYAGDVWDMDALIALADRAEATWRAPAPWKFVQWEPTEQPDFRNMPGVYRQAAS